uniref:Peptidase S1 domain-containing protein n=1 Tax=Gopherus evgoodei TaxID=1825980 RepID=A0A8C4Y3G1_9SAUR
LLHPGVFIGATHSGQRTTVIGGQEAPLGSRPYMAYVQIRSTGSCGGFLIHEDDVVVTAAHCNCNLGQPVTHQGAGSGLVPLEEKGPVSNFIPPDPASLRLWDGIGAGNMLPQTLELWHSAELTEWVGLVSLPEADQHIGPGSECSVAGWGRTGVNTTTDTLQEAEQEVVSDSLCREQYQHYNPTTMLCAGSPLTNQSGDSGGPLVCNGVVQGIVSNGNPDGRPPSIYTRISKFIPWITETLQKLS